MLKLTGKDGGAAELTDACWIDLCEPTAEEIERVQTRFGVELPSREQLAEIEASSRLRAHRDRLTMSAPLIARHEGIATLSPTGFLLLTDVLITVRFAPM